MPTDGDTVEIRKPEVTPKQLSRQASKRKDSEEGGEPRPGQINGVKNSGLFGFVQYFMERPDISSQSSGTSSPSVKLPAAVSITAIEVPGSNSPAAGRSLQLTSIFPGSPDHEIVKNEVCSDGSKSDKSEMLRSESGLEVQLLQSSRTYLKSEEYRQLFHLPPEEILVEDFNCALQKKILLQGHMYLFERYVCFYSNIFGYEKKKVIPLKDITCVRKAKTAGVFPNAIEMTSWGKKQFFASFLSRDEAYRLIINGWSQHSGYARMFLSTHYSPTSSPPSQGGISLDSTVMSLTWQSPQRAVSILAEGPVTTRDVGEGPNVVEPTPVEVARDIGSLQELVEPANEDNSAGVVSEESLSIIESSSVSTASVCPIWEIEDLDAPGLPEGYKTVAESEFSVDVEEFFQLFFSDDAVGFNKNFHSKCGDDDFRCTQWAKHRHFGHARDISFRHPVNFYFGPKSTYCHESQRFRVYRNSHFVLETSQQMTDIPYGDYFRVEVRWDVERLCGKGSYHCFVRVSLGVTFSKKTVWKGKIEQGTHDESKEAYATWIREAHSMLREIRSMAVEAGTVENLPAAPSSDTEETIMEMTSHGNETILCEVEQPVHRIQEEEHGRIPEEERSIYAADRPARAPKAGEESGSLNFKSAEDGIQWRKKGSAVLGTIILTSQKIWDKGYNLDLKTNKQLKLLCFMLIATIVILMQVGIMIALVRSPKLEYAPVGYQNTERASGTCFGGPRGHEALTWLEQRARYLKEEIIMAEARLQTLHQDLTALKLHATHLISYVDNQSNPQQTSV